MLFRKTRIALEYASKHKKSDSVSVFWVHASTAERMEKAYREIAKEARLSGAEDPKVNQLQLVKKWLEGEDSGTWVLVIDNADDENLFFGENENRGQTSYRSSDKLAQYFPQRLNGSILLTTRNRMLGVKFATVRGVVTIPEMSVLESKSLLLENLEEGDYDDHELTELVEVLENLPLALVQAAAFIGEKSQLISEYLQTYRGSDWSKIRLLSQNFEDSERDPDIKNPVAVTWMISFEQIKNNDPRAAELLSLMSVLDRQAIPKSLLLSDIEELDLDIALGTLKAFSLITVEQNRFGGESEVKCTGRRPEFNLHRLVYLATRNWLKMNKELDTWTGKALVLLSDFFPSPEFENQDIWMAYLPHANTILNSDHSPASGSIAQASLLYYVAWAHERKGDYALAEMMAWKSLHLREKLLGKMHTQTLHSLNHLGVMLWRQGKIEEAEQISRQALDGFEEMLGKEHLSTLSCVNDLGLVLGYQGKYIEAEKLHYRALSGNEKVRGKEHSQTLKSVNNLGLVLRLQGKYEEAEKLHRGAMSSREKVLGKEHPETLNSVDNLGLVLDDQGKYEEAEKAHRRALSANEKILGKEHPSTLNNVENLGFVLLNQGKYEEAEKVYRRALSGREKTLGKEHPDTFRSISYLAYLFHKRGQYQNALPLYQKACAGLEKTLGSDSPHTVWCANAYSRMLNEMRSDLQQENENAVGEDP